MKVALFVADTTDIGFKKIVDFSARTDIIIKHVAGSQTGGLGLLYIWYEDVDVQSEE